MSLQSFSQNPTFIKWENCYGGSQWEYLYCGAKTIDSCYVFGGYTNSNDGDIQSGFKGDSDSWILKIDSTGNIQWEKTYGGSSGESIIDIIHTSDGGFLLGGYTHSTDGDVQSGNKGQYDFWIIKINSIGSIEWEKTYGGSNDDFVFSIQTTSDNGYILGGETQSDDGDIQSVNNGGHDFWVIKTNSIGTIEWEKTFGGSNDEYLKTVLKTEDGYILGGYSNSNDGDIQSINKGETDWWVVKIDNSGNIKWEKTYGGSSEEQLFSIVSSSYNDGYLLCGYSSSKDGDIQSGGIGLTNSWVVKIDTMGSIQWEKTYGGSGIDFFMDIQTTENGYLLGGNSSSTDGDVQSGNKDGGLYDYWVVEIDNTGRIEWEKTYGGSNEDNFVSLLSSNNDEFIIGGYSKSNDKDIRSGNNGKRDFWVLKIGMGSTPSDIRLTNDRIDENTSDSTIVGKLLSIDEDINDNYAYSFVSGDGDSDNNSFIISGDTLLTNEVFDFETKSSYSIRIQTEDSEGHTFTKYLIVYVTNLNELHITDTLIVNPKCSQFLSGSIEYKVNEYVLPLKFQWSNGDTTQNLYDIGFGEYSVTIVDGDSMTLNCNFVVDTIPIYEGSSICYVSSDGESNVIHIDKGENNYNVEKYLLYREGISQNDYEKIGEIICNENYFIDSLINNRTQSFSYKVWVQFSYYAAKLP